MKITSKSRSVRQLIRQIKSGSINLQPEFQRGVVWSKLKKQKLVDSILRAWYVPPVHLVAEPHGQVEDVLDGKQRLEALWDFQAGVFPVNGKVEPASQGIAELDGLHYESLPAKYREAFDAYELGTIVLTEYEADEPSELFYRLNQPVNLTPSEQRNAFYGNLRFQVRDYVDRLDSFGITEKLLGFRNARMAYDDIIARAGYTLLKNSLREKVTAHKLAELYRSGEPFPPRVTNRLESAFYCFGSARGGSSLSIHFNKATAYSWLCFFGSMDPHGEKLRRDLGSFLLAFEQARSSITRRRVSIQDSLLNDNESWADWVDRITERSNWGFLALVFADRASSRVSDVSSVLLRDAVIWLAFATIDELNHLISPEKLSALGELWGYLQGLNVEDPDLLAEMLLFQLDEMNWGTLIQ